MGRHVVLDKQTFNGRTFTRQPKKYWRATDGNRESMHKYVWETTTRLKVPAGHCIVHVDRNYDHNWFDNLECVLMSEKGKYSARNNKFCKGRGPQPIIAKFCISCGGRLRKGTTAYQAKRKYCSMRCHGEHIRGTPRGFTGLEADGYRKQVTAMKLVLPVRNIDFNQIREEA